MRWTRARWPGTPATAFERIVALSAGPSGLVAVGSTARLYAVDRVLGKASHDILGAPTKLVAVDVEDDLGVVGPADRHLGVAGEAGVDGGGDPAAADGVTVGSRHQLGSAEYREGSDRRTELKTPFGECVETAVLLDETVADQCSQPLG